MTSVQAQEESIIPGVAIFPSGTTYLTQARIPTFPTTTDIVRRTVFSSENVQTLKEEDFALDSKIPIALKYNDCILVLFFTENTESNSLAVIWSIVAQQVSGPVFAACNLVSEKKVAQAFTKVGEETSNPVNWAGLGTIPFILVYRKGWPVAFYNGTRSVQRIADYSLTLACSSLYTERYRLGLGVQAEASVIMAPFSGKTTDDAKKKSTDFIEISERGYEPRVPITSVGSRDQVAANELLQRLIADRKSISDSINLIEQRQRVERLERERSQAEVSAIQSLGSLRDTATGVASPLS